MKERRDRRPAPVGHRQPMQVTGDADESCFEGVVGTVPRERTGTEVASRQTTVSQSRVVRMSGPLEKELGGRVI